MLALTGDGSRGVAETSGGVWGTFLWRTGCVDGVWGWCIIGWPSFACLGELLRGVACIFETYAGHIFMKELVLSSVYTRLYL